MSFLGRYNEILQKTPVSPERKLLIHSHIFGILLILLIGVVIYLQRGEYSLRYFNHTIAWVSVVMIGLSFALSGICYFWNFADTKIIYRKHIGIVGFFYALLHGTLTVYLLSLRTNLLEYFTSPDHFWPFFFGFSALLYFGFMYAISNQYAAHELGGKKWRMLLRLGYIAFIAAMIHFVSLRLPLWGEWWSTGDYFAPPISLILSLGSVFVIVLRLILALRVHLKKISSIK